MAIFFKLINAFLNKTKVEEIVYSHGKYAIQYDSTSWTIINPNDADDSAYAHLSYMYHFTDNYPKGTLLRKSIYFSDLIDTEDVYHELKKIDSFWVPGITDRVGDIPYCFGEPVRISPE